MEPACTSPTAGGINYAMHGYFESNKPMLLLNVLYIINCSIFIRISV